MPRLFGERRHHLVQFLGGGNREHVVGARGRQMPLERMPDRRLTSAGAAPRSTRTLRPESLWAANSLSSGTPPTR